MCNKEEKKLELLKALNYVSILAKKAGGVPESKELYIRISLRIGEELYVSRWGAWEDPDTREKLIFLVTDNKCVLTDFRNVEKIEFFYKKPETKAIGFREAKGPVEIPPAWLEFLGLEENNSSSQGR